MCVCGGGGDCLPVNLAEIPLYPYTVHVRCSIQYSAEKYVTFDTRIINTPVSVVPIHVRRTTVLVAACKHSGRANESIARRPITASDVYVFRSLLSSPCQQRTIVVFQHRKFRISEGKYDVDRVGLCITGAGRHNKQLLEPR